MIDLSAVAILHFLSVSFCTQFPTKCEKLRGARAELVERSATQTGHLTTTLAKELDELRQRLKGSERRVEVLFTIHLDIISIALT